MTISTTFQPLAQTGITRWVADYHTLAQVMAAAIDTDFVPASFRPAAFLPKGERPTPQAIERARETAVASATIGATFGMSLGLGSDPFAALQNVYVVSGRPGLYAASMVALVQSAGHELWVEDLTDTRAVVCGRRSGTEHSERVTVTMDQARRAGWTRRNPNYESNPQAMLLARAQAQVCRRIAQDCLKGLGQAVEELHDEDTTTSAPNGTRTVRRATPQALTASAASPPIPQATSTPPPTQRHAGPPLPGEDPHPTTPDAAPRPVTDPQLRKMGAVFSSLGVTGDGSRADRLIITSRIIGDRPITSSKDLTADEATLVIDTLTGITPDTLEDLLTPAADTTTQDGHGEDYDPTTDDDWDTTTGADLTGEDTQP